MLRLGSRPGRGNEGLARVGHLGDPGPSVRGPGHLPLGAPEGPTNRGAGKQRLGWGKPEGPLNLQASSIW